MLGQAGAPIQRATFRRDTLLQFFERAARTVVGMEACPGSQWLARRLRASRDRLGGWIDGLQRRMHANKVTVALAAKVARIAWVVITSVGGDNRSAGSVRGIHDGRPHLRSYQRARGVRVVRCARTRRADRADAVRVHCAWSSGTADTGYRIPPEGRLSKRRVARAECGAWGARSLRLRPGDYGLSRQRLTTASHPF